MDENRTIAHSIEQEIDSLNAALLVNRRGFVKTSLGAGFAAAVLPVAAQTITTDTRGLDAGETRVLTNDGDMPAYYARPAGKSGLATVLVVQEVFGVHEHIKDVCRRFAKQGFLAVAPELYARQGDPGQYSDTGALMKEIVSKVSDAQVIGDLDATALWAAKRGGNPDKLGITGFCWGGRATLMYGAHNPRLKAVVPWYGPLSRSYYPGDKTVLDVAANIKAPVLGLYGGADGGVPIDTVEKLRAALKAAGNTRSEIIVYPDAPHAFHADYRPSYRKEAAEDGWKRAVAWVKTHLA
jgi:carboxymethylenebutenolidase